MTEDPDVPEDILTTHHFMGTKLLNNHGFARHVFVCKVSVVGD